MALFARALSDAAAGRSAVLGFRRSDGLLHEVAATVYLDPFAHDEIERQLLEGLLARLPPGARVLDLGCGSGRHARWLAARGLAVDAIDASPAVVGAARALGTAARVASVFDLEPVGRGGPAPDAILLGGNAIGLCGALEGLVPLLERLGRLAPLVALDSVDYGPGRGRARVRLEYAGATGPWFDWLHLARDELAAAAAAAGLDLEVLGPAADRSFGAFLRR